MKIIDNIFGFHKRKKVSGSRKCCAKEMTEGKYSSAMNSARLLLGLLLLPLIAGRRLAA